MSLIPPPKHEVLIPLLLNFLEKKLGRPLSLPHRPFSVDTKDLIETFDENSCAQLILERLLLENHKENLYREDLLKLLLEIERLPGYLFIFRKAEKQRTYPFFQLSEDLYFYPLLFENTASLFIELWRSEASFSSIYLMLDGNYSHEDLKRRVEIAEKLGFTRLGTKALDDLEDVLDLYISGESEKILKNLNTSEDILVIFEGAPDLPEGFQPITLHRGKRYTFVLLRTGSKGELLDLLSDLSSPSGSIEGSALKDPLFADLDPFLLTYSSLEHAKRAGKRHHHLEPFTLHVLADLFYEWEDYGSALRLYLRAKDHTLQPIELALSLASIYYILSDLVSAERTLRSKLCGCLREDPRIHYNLGIVYLSLGRREQAEYHLYKAFLLNKEEPLFRRQLLRFLWDEGRFEEIQELMKDISDPTPEEKAYLGKIAFLKGDYETALNYLKDILAYRDRDGLSLYFLAWLYMYFRMDGEVSRILLDEARKRLSDEEYNRLLKEFGLPQ